MAHALMIQGTGSNVGKSLIVAGLCRAFAARGLRVAPFKPQNMSNNAAVTADGGEIGRAQALQARAAGIVPTTDMNPLLIKPESETGAQIILQGRRLRSLSAADYGGLRDLLLPKVLESFRRLAAKHDLIVVEGAGSPAEVNLRSRDIANMGFARAANVPVILTGDIDRGGVIAQLVGSHAVLDTADRAMIRGFLVNKFRGDPALFRAGMDLIAARTGWPALGLLPWFPEAWRLPAEDVLDLAGRPGGALRIAVPRLPRIANFDDLDPLAADPGVTLDIVEPGRAMPGDAALVILPGSKATIPDLAFLRAQGWDIDIAAHLRRGGRVTGICGGYQMLGRAIHDPQGIEGPAGSVAGLGLLDVETTLLADKVVTARSGHACGGGERVSGYEIHLGRTSGPGRARPWIMIDGCGEGAVSDDGRVRGCYLHGLFAADGFRAAFLRDLGLREPAGGHATTVDATLDRLGAMIAAETDLDRLLALATRVPATTGP